MRSTHYKIDYPKKGLKTTVAPLPGKNVIIPYNPLLHKIKKDRTTYRYSSKKRYTKKKIHNTIL